MPAHSSLKASDSHNTLKSSIVPGGFSALSLNLDAKRHSFHHITQHLHSGATAATLHHSHTINPESDTWRFLGSMAASQRYKIHSLRAIIHEVTGRNGVLAIPEPDDRFLHNYCPDPGSDCGGLLGSTPATQRYKGRLCCIKLMKSLTLVGIVFIDTPALSELDARFLHNHAAESGSNCGTLLGPMPASQWCMVPPSANFIHEVTGPNRVLAISELDYRYLYNHCFDPGSDCGRLLGSTPARQRYNGRPCRI